MSVLCSKQLYRSIGVWVLHSINEYDFFLNKITVLMWEQLTVSCTNLRFYYAAALIQAV